MTTGTAPNLLGPDHRHANAGDDRARAVISAYRLSGKPMPTILITAYPDDGVRERALSAGVIGYLSKPFDENDLLACNRSALTHAVSQGR
jgi:CheY-like chemotaxis protein